MGADRKYGDDKFFGLALRYGDRTVAKFLLKISKQT